MLRIRRSDTFADIDFSVFTDDTSYALIKTLVGYNDAVQAAAERYEPSVIARYLISVAVAFNKFYHECSILHAEEHGTKSFACETLAPSAVACDIFQSRECASLAERFLRYRKFAISYSVKKARLLLTDLVQKVLTDGCGLLGMECPEEM